MPRGLRIAVWTTAGLMTGVVVITGLLFMIGGRKIDRRFAVPDERLMLPADSASLAEGERLSLVLGCADCHAANLAGSEMIDAPMFAVLPATNLTRGAGGVGADYGAAGFERAIRHGIDAAGRPSRWTTTSAAGASGPSAALPPRSHPGGCSLPSRSTTRPRIRRRSRDR